MDSRQTRITIVAVVLLLMLALYIGHRWIGLMPAPRRERQSSAADAAKWMRGGSRSDSAQSADEHPACA